ncbi:hypothetical protein BJ742DRAFT_799461 [Cladochytrium replicatum]|nr:hypothetical protein BJ742DRAFT_799461 [Cladochytrium replicatum]
MFLPPSNPSNHRNKTFPFSKLDFALPLFNSLLCEKTPETLKIKMLASYDPRLNVAVTRTAKRSFPFALVNVGDPYLRFRVRVLSTPSFVLYVDVTASPSPNDNTFYTSLFLHRRAGFSGSVEITTFTLAGTDVLPKPVALGRHSEFYTVSAKKWSSDDEDWDCEVVATHTHSDLAAEEPLPEEDLNRLLRTEKPRPTARLLFSESLSDFTITVHTPEADFPIHAHRSVLACILPYFERLFDHPELKEGSSNLLVIDDPDQDVDTIRALLTFVYVGELADPPKTIEAAVRLLKAADYYSCDSLRGIMERLIIRNQWIAVDTIVELYDLSMACSPPLRALRTACMHFISSNHRELAERMDTKSEDSTSGFNEDSLVGMLVTMARIMAADV